MRRVVVLVTGFGKLQNRRIKKGLIEIADALNKRGGPYEVGQFAWNEIEDIEKFIAGADEVIGGGHSYGAATIAKIAERNKATRFSHVVFTDGIWRKELCEPSIKSVRPGVIELSSNVEQFHNFYQGKGVLQGEDTTIKLAPNTAYTTRIRVKRPGHIRMDRLPELKDLLMRLAA